ncbi:MAG: SRPBCC family protein [Actinomycetia bacterium]|nr:SRPBCC family protein [Actinomycetes bacterium]
MELNNEFEVERGIQEAWEILTDVERIAPCLPGAQLTEIEGDDYRGIVKVKVGPITAQYKGSATFVEKDDENHKAVLDAKGRDTRGQGNATAQIIAQLTELSPTNTKVVVTTDLTVTGKVAQFGRGVMADVSEKLLDQFVGNLETTVLTEGAASAAEEVPAAAPASADSSGNGAGEAPKVRKIDAPAAEPVDLLDATGAPILKRVAPILAVLFVLLVLRRLLGGGES